MFMSDQPTEQTDNVEVEKSEENQETEKQEQENPSVEESESKPEKNDQPTPSSSKVDEKEKQDESKIKELTREERGNQPTATIEIKEESTPEVRSQKPTEQIKQEVKEIPPAPQEPIPEPVQIPPPNNNNDNNSNPFGGWTSWFTSKVETSLQSFTDFIVPPIDSDNNTPKTNQQQQQQQQPPPSSTEQQQQLSSSTTANTTTKEQIPNENEEVPLIPESARIFLNKLMQGTTKVAEKVQHKVNEIAHNVQEEGIVNASQHVLNDLGDKIKEVSHQVSHTLLPTPSPDIDNNDDESDSDPLSFQAAFIKIKGYETVKIINNLKETIESDLSGKLGLLSPPVSSIYDATFATIDNELSNESSSNDVEFKITDEEESKWIWTEINEYREMIGSASSKIDKFINNINEQLSTDNDINQSLKDYLNQILSELQSLVLTLYTSITSLYLKIILQVVLYYNSSEDNSYLNPSQAVRLSEIIRFHFQEYTGLYLDFIGLMHSISFEKMVCKYFDKHEKKEEDNNEIKSCQDTFDNYLKLLDSQSKTLMESKKEIFNPLVKSQMINSN